MLLFKTIYSYLYHKKKTHQALKYINQKHC